MEEGLIVLRLHGLDVRNGRIPTDAFTAYIRRFAATLAIFERTFTGRRARSTDLNVTTLSRENPMVVGLRPESRVRGYSPTAAMHWAFDEIERIGKHQPSDPRIPLEAYDSLIGLADGDDGGPEGVAVFTAIYDGQRINFDQNLAGAAKEQRIQALTKLPAPTWFAGVSKGTIMGELRGAIDLDGEREFFIKMLTGRRNLRCIFSEDMRDDMNKLLFKPIKITGFLHYDGQSPQPNLVEAITISALIEEGIPHLLDLTGLFTNSYYTSAPDLSE